MQTSIGIHALLNMYTGAQVTLAHSTHRCVGTRRGTQQTQVYTIMHAFIQVGSVSHTGIREASLHALGMYAGTHIHTNIHKVHKYTQNT